MAPFNPFIASFNFTNTPTFSHGLRQFVVDRSLILAAIQGFWADAIAWLSQPPGLTCSATEVYTCIIVWAVVFTVVLTLILGLGFGPGGVAAGSLAAAFQAWMYGGFTPAAGIFATLTSLGMLGMLVPSVVAIAACVATAAVVIVWLCGIGA